MTCVGRWPGDSREWKGVHLIVISGQLVQPGTALGKLKHTATLLLGSYICWTIYGINIYWWYKESPTIVTSLPLGILNNTVSNYKKWHLFLIPRSTALWYVPKTII